MSNPLQINESGYRTTAKCNEKTLMHTWTDCESLAKGSIHKIKISRFSP